MAFSGCYFLFTRWVLYQTHPGPSPGLAGPLVGLGDVCLTHSFYKYLWKLLCQH